MRLWIEDGLSVRELAGRVAGEADELVLLPADAPDLPPLVLAKMFKVLHRVDVVVAPQRGGGGCLALGLALPLAAWVPDQALDLDHDPRPVLAGAAARRSHYASAPDWHRLRTAADLMRLDPKLEGWEETRLLLSDTPVG